MALLMIASVASAQNQSSEQTTVRKSGDPSNDLVQSECMKTISTPETKQITFLGNVTLKTDKFECKNATKAIYDQTLKKLTVYGCKSFSIQGEIILSQNKKIENILEYTIGDNKIFIN